MRSTVAAALAAFALLAALDPAVAQTPGVNTRMGLSTVGARVFQQTCAICHVSAGDTGADPRAPKLETLRQYPPERILDALTTGKMKAQGSTLSEGDRKEVAEWLSARALGAASLGDADAMPNRCAAGVTSAAGPAWNGWGVDARNGRFTTAAAAGLSAADLPRLKLKWAFGFPAGVQSFSQPAIVGGRLFVGSDSGQVYALDPRTGCVHWSFLAGGGVRTAPVVMTIHNKGATRSVVVVGDMKARLYALDVRDGSLVWSTAVDEQPLARITAAPTAYRGRLYVGVSTSEEGSARMEGYECCRHRGSVVAIDASDGRRLWKTYMQPPPRAAAPDAAGKRRWAPAGGAVWASPTVDAKRGRIYVATGDAYAPPAGRLTDAVVALGMATGKVLWSHQEVMDDVWVAGCRPGVTTGCPDDVGPDWDYASSAVLQTLPGGRDMILAVHKGGVAVGLDPDRNGALVWRNALSEQPPKFGPAEVMFGAAVDRSHAYVATQETQKVESLDLATGKRVWAAPIASLPARAPHHGAGAAVSGMPGAVFSGGWDGVLRAFSTADGRLLWSFDTGRAFPSVNGIPAKGGSMGSGGATLAGGMVFVGSGYVGVNDGIPGNALLAFGL